MSADTFSTSGVVSKAVERELVRQGTDAQGAEAGTVTFDSEYERQL